MNLYYCSDGSRVSQNSVNSRYQQSRRSRYAGYPMQFCHGCGAACNGSAHIIAQARCKVIHKTELIWDVRNYFPSCASCNLAIENPKGEGWKRLKNIEYCLIWIELNDPELFSKFEMSGANLPRH